MSRIKIGDLVEIKTALGYSYAQYTHKHAQYGALLRVFSKVYKQRPETWENIFSDDVRFSVFFPLQAAINQKIFCIVGNLSIPAELLNFPLFRAGAVNPSTKKVSTWWLWDGVNEVKIGHLTDEQKHLPIRGIWNDTILIERIESNWSPYTDPTT
ncbi:TPA: hypothetical protein RQK80_004350 [Vibrio vulnificus]|nr:hypothetical protein [Vibrio vulnificus]